MLSALVVSLAIGAAFVAFGLGGGSAHAATPHAHAASQKPYTAKLSYNETNSGRQQGQATVGIVGHGTFSAKLSPAGAFDAALIAVATDAPISKIAQGGTYVVQRQIAGDGDVTGLAVTRFKARGLGTACVSYTEKPGRFVIGMSFVPMTGAIKTVGGTGAAATWKLKVSFKQNSVNGTNVESFGANGSEQAGAGAAHA